MMAKAYFTSYKLPIVITRGNNVYAPCADAARPASQCRSGRAQAPARLTLPGCLGCRLLSVGNGRRSVPCTGECRHSCAS